jgi:hypothetical protein
MPEQGPPARRILVGDDRARDLRPIQADERAEQIPRAQKPGVHVAAPAHHDVAHQVLCHALAQRRGHDVQVQGHGVAGLVAPAVQPRLPIQELRAVALGDQPPFDALVAPHLLLAPQHARHLPCHAEAVQGVQGLEEVPGVRIVPARAGPAVVAKARLGLAVVRRGLPRAPGIVAGDAETEPSRGSPGLR